MKRRLAILCAVVLLFSLAGCRSEQPNIVVETAGMREVVENIEFVKALEYKAIDNAVMCYSDSHQGEAGSVVCEQCIVITDEKVIKNLHKSLNKMRYDSQKFSAADRYDGETTYPLYFVVDGKFTFAGWWHKDIVYANRATDIYGGKEQLRIEYGWNSPQVSEILAEHYDYFPKDTEKTTQMVLEKVQEIDGETIVLFSGHYGGLQQSHNITDPEQKAAVKEMLKSIKLVPAASQFQMPGDYDHSWGFSFYIDNLSCMLLFGEGPIGNYNILSVRGFMRDRTIEENSDAEGLFYEIENPQEIINQLNAIMEKMPKKDF